MVLISLIYSVPFCENIGPRNRPYHSVPFWEIVRPDTVPFWTHCTYSMLDTILFIGTLIYFLRSFQYSIPVFQSSVPVQ